MYQKGWVKNWIMVAECERCWRTEIFLFENGRFLERFEVEVVEDVEDFLSRILTKTEIKAILNGKRDEEYRRVEKKLEELNLSVDEILKVLRRC